MDKLKEYAEIILRSGINLKEGQCVRIRCGVEDYHFARLLGQEAYRMGSGYVHIDILDNYLDLSRFSYQKEEQLDYIPHFLIDEGRVMLDEDWANIRIDNVGEGNVLKDADPGNVARNRRALGRELKFFNRSLMADEHSWCVVALPGKSWAEKVLGKGATVEELWDVLKPILRLDRDDPTEAWEEHNNTLHARCDRYNGLKFDRIRFRSEGTDLTVGLSERSLWCGGPMPLADGRLYNANIPSEEIFTTPDWRRTEGYVKVTKPVSVREKMVTGAEFRFEKGKVVSFRAEEGEDALKEYFDTDEGASFLGEIALVQNDSPISNSGLIFHSILYDENASCHMALGAGYPSCLKDFKELDSAEKLKDAGCNDSMVHTDFMIGGPDTELTAYTVDGKEIPLMKDGNFLL
ncbi:aminopeptidase [Spirochaeta isovalerica]|uniref:Aminopeptidase n=1 Tax=Spirochaeta isovalerica TaxID=150 RepID=A0A841RDI9_9SPIO|nr:aminopeptidase [Spirochaeta isovalerica]MBB6481451.1 aminopeptidase [Spirochaeta isovalerica]